MILRTALITPIRQLFRQGIHNYRINYRPCRRYYLCLLTICLSLSISACADWLPEAHRLDLQQGNTIKLEQLEAIEIGMSKAEVRKIMGSPMLSDPFHDQRWDYIYRFIPNKGFERKSLLTLYFEDDILIKIDDSEYVEP